MKRRLEQTLLRPNGARQALRRLRWRVLVGVWCLAGLVAWQVPWTYGLVVVFFATFVHLSAVDSAASSENR